VEASELITTSAVLVAAVLHAGWNALAKHDADRTTLLARSSLVGMVLAVAGLLVVAAPAAASWPWLAGSIVLHVAYNAGLLWAYHVGDFNQTYPLARGVGPLVVAAFATLVLNEPLAAPATVGVVVIAVSIGVLGFTPWHRVRANRPVVVAAVLTGLAIATYTILDGVGVRRSGSSAGYTLWLVGMQALLTIAGLRLWRRRSVPRGSSGWWAAVAVAAMSAAAYGLVLWAQTRGALAAVAALRETSVIVAALIGMLFFKEPMGRVRIVASVAVAGGVILLSAF